MAVYIYIYIYIYLYANLLYLSYRFRIVHILTTESSRIITKLDTLKNVDTCINHVSSGLCLRCACGHVPLPVPAYTCACACACSMCLFHVAFPPHPLDDEMSMVGRHRILFREMTYEYQYDLGFGVVKV